MLKKKIITILLISALIISTVLSGCTKGPEKGDNSSSSADVSSKQIEYTDPVASLTATASQDKYRNFYEIFVYSFCDSNDDGVGDLQGVISKLDYLNDGDPNAGDDLGIDAIWFMPVMPSPSYHKYDVTDYYNIDPEYGTLNDFKQLIAECDKRGIKVIIDLVLNHCSDENPLFEKACEEIENGKTDGYAEMFSICKADEKPNYSYPIDDDWYYEANFVSSMPEFNLSSEKTREEFKKIMEFWLNLGVAGFRLDALKYYDGINEQMSDQTDGQEFLEWLYSTAKAIKSDVYMVGEMWDTSTKIKNYYETGIDSLFYFDGATTTGKFISAVRGKNSKTLVNTMKKYQDSILKRNPNAINSLFLSNHDQTRSAGALSNDLADQKMAAALYMLFPGNSFIYYGEEIGMNSIDTDPSRRTQMIWSEKNPVTILPPGYESENIPVGGGVEEQQKDEYSLLNFYKRIIKIKNQNPAIARGKITETIDIGDNSVGAYIVEYEGQKNIIIHNLSDETKTFKIPSEKIKDFELVGELVASNDAKTQLHVLLNNDTLTMPPQSTFVACHF